MRITKFSKTVWVDFDRLLITFRLRMKEFLFGFSYKNDKNNFTLFVRPIPFTEIYFMFRKKNCW